MSDGNSNLSEGQRHLPKERAFIVQLTGDADPMGGNLMGRAVHIRTGQIAMFEDTETLFRFFAAIADDPGI